MYCISRAVLAILPAVALVTLLTNGLACCVLVRRRMRTASNAILAALSVSNTVTALTPAPVYLFFYAFGHHADFLSSGWCKPHTVLASYLPTSFHVVSVWLTLLLAVQRYLHVCRSGSGGRRTNSWARPPMSRISLAIGALFVLGPVFQSIQLMLHTCEPVTVPSRTAGMFINDGRLSYTNMTSYALDRLLGANYERVMLMHQWAHVLCVNFVPSILLIIFNALLIAEIRKSIARRARLRLCSSGNITLSTTSNNNNNNGSNNNSSNTAVNKKPKRRVRRGDSQSTTLMLVTVLCISLVLEVPLGLTRLVQTLNFTFELGLSKRSFMKLAVLLNALIVVSYPANLLIYCAMSRLFRRAFLRQLRALCCCLSWIPYCNPNGSPHSTELLSFELASRQIPIAPATNGASVNGNASSESVRAKERAADQLDISPDEQRNVNFDSPVAVVGPLVARVRFPTRRESSPVSTPSPPHPTRTPAPGRAATNPGALTALKGLNVPTNTSFVKFTPAEESSEREHTTNSTTTTTSSTAYSYLTAQKDTLRLGVHLNPLGALQRRHELENGGFGIELDTPSPTPSDRSRGSFRLALL